jgi:uncharacterized repeat protein (TIGR03803 family)
MVFKENKLYGMTQGGGENGMGVIFEFNLDTNTYTRKFNFDIINGIYPKGSLIFIKDKLYGMTYQGGGKNTGVIFEFDPSINFYKKLIDLDIKTGDYPRGSLLVLGKDKLIGMTSFGGENNKGVIFEFDLGLNVYNNSYNFNMIDGNFPYDSLIYGNRKLYGMTQNGGSFNEGVIFEYDLTR